MNFLKKIFKSLFQVNVVINTTSSNNQSIIYRNGKLTVNGKEVDPKSPEGKRALKQIDQTMIKVGKEMTQMGNELARDMNQLSKDLSNMFK